MKSLKALFLVAVLGVLSCAGIPKPETPQDTLVVGSFVLDFPDGFFDDPPRAITSGIELTITNTTKDSSFSVRTGPNGYYSFLSNGSDSFSLTSFFYEEKTLSSRRATIHGTLDMPFETNAGQVRYVGKVTVIYQRPQRTYKNTGDRTIYWAFEPSVSSANCRDEMIEYIKSMDPECEWLSRDVDEQILGY